MPIQIKTDVIEYTIHELDTDPVKTSEVAMFKFIDLDSNWSMSVNGTFEQVKTKVRRAYSQYMNADFGQVHLKSISPVKQYLG